MNKEIERARREADERETQKMFKVINAKHKEAYNEWLLNEQIKKIAKEKEEKKETVIDFVWVVVVFMVLFSLFVAMLVFLYKDGEEYIKDCTAAGYSEDYCVSQL